MYLSAERLALANQTILETFAQTSVAWQAIPNWATGDPTQTLVRNDNLATPGFVPIVPTPVGVSLTLAEAIAPTADALLSTVTAGASTLAAQVDDPVVLALDKFPGVPVVTLASTNVQGILDGLIDARALLEKAGYRAPSCLITNNQGIKDLNQLVSGYYIIKDQLLDAAYINSLHRVDRLEKPAGKAWAIMLGRRQRIPHGRAAEASSGEEPVDLAVSVQPSLEVVGDTPTNTIDLRVRISYATRIKDKYGLVILTT